LPEGLSDAIEWIKTNPKVFVPACLFVLLIGFLVGRYYVYAEGCHLKGEVAYEGVASIQRSLDDAALKKQAVNEYVAEKCRAGELPDSPATCAKAIAAVESTQ
jgi:hypothetical protein